MRFPIGLLVFICSAVSVTVANLRPCIQRNYGYDSNVCVCNATYCDNLHSQPELLLKNGSYLHYSSTREGKRLEYTLKSFQSNKVSDPESVHFKINISQRFQEVLGFGGAMTDATGMNILSLSEPAQENLLRQYFSSEGAEYTFIRVPMGGTDFSPRYYSYDDVIDDDTLSHFNITREDLNYKIPFLRRAKEMSSRDIRLITASWTPPDWMKEVRLRGLHDTRLADRYYQLYADYIIRFFEAYDAHGLQFFALSCQNEPQGQRYDTFDYNSLGWTPDEEKKFIKKNLGPTLLASDYSYVKIMLNDDQRFNVPYYGTELLEDKSVRDLVWGIAVHFYFDFMSNSPPSLLDQAHALFPDKVILYTEACIVPDPGPNYIDTTVQLGNWSRGENYTYNILEDLNHWSAGWIDWNLVLDPKGGPNWAANVADAAIIVNATADEFYKQPMFYAQAHFSKFIPPGSLRVELKTENKTHLKYSAFLTPSNMVALVFLNREDEDVNAVISTGSHDDIVINVPGHSIHTLLYNSQ